MDYLPLFLKLEGKRCLVVGAGEVAVRKASLVLKAGATVDVVSPQCCAAMAQLVADHEALTYRNSVYTAADLSGAQIVIAATDHPEVNEAVSTDAHKANVLVNVVDQPDLCSFILPAVIDRSPVVVAVSSGGNSPVLARTIRTKLESLIPAAYGKLAELVGEFREQAKQRFSSVNERRTFWESVLEGPIAELVFAGDMDKAKQMLSEHFTEPEDPSKDGMGEVYLVGGGPGDPDLLTFRALRLMQKSDVILYDRLVAPEIVDLCRRDARRIYVGKARDKHTLPQQEINQMLVDLARQGHRVCRLKGGDPFIFGRGGEEIDLLSQCGVPFQVVPGITAASGCASYSGIPLTHRDYSQSVQFVTGHLQPGAKELDWAGLVRDRQTLVIYMGLLGLDKICQRLIEHQMSEDMPVALVERGTTPEQKVYVGTLKTMPEQIKQLHIKPPTLIIVGEVVRLRERLAWFSPKN
ncbi:MAG: uroporphyrinogen-III C-methyltransferase [Gammaproteobacteria bacterium]|nr:MAG: uroporphyrinogen-III C-methyltransferase [Gammaproteobacteria bacterium]